MPYVEFRSRSLRGEIYGFIGPNGAGKSTTIKVLATLIGHFTGTAKINGIDVARRPQEVREQIGYMPDFFGVYEDLNVREYLHFFAAAYRIPPKQRKTVIDDVLELTDLTHKIGDQVDSLSRGMKQRLAWPACCCTTHSCCSSTSRQVGLDPRARIEVRELLKALTEMGKTILISSHILHELAHLCTRIGIIETGEMVAQGSLQEIYRQLQLMRIVHVQLTGSDDGVVDQIRKIQGVADVEQQVDRLAIQLREDHAAVEELQRPW
ncbi:MAG: ABC transporter ATP-binding protein [Planctomycetaceae bacterium]|nr:MAG: ABC transporter ATP-binding protein [Planctomycetaceae bacterium]